MFNPSPEKLPVHQQDPPVLQLPTQNSKGSWLIVINFSCFLSPAFYHFSCRWTSSQEALVGSCNQGVIPMVIKYYNEDSMVSYTSDNAPSFEALWEFTWRTAMIDNNNEPTVNLLDQKLLMFIQNPSTLTGFTIGFAGPSQCSGSMPHSDPRWHYRDVTRIVDWFCFHLLRPSVTFLQRGFQLFDTNRSPQRIELLECSPQPYCTDCKSCFVPLITCCKNIFAAWKHCHLQRAGTIAPHRESDTPIKSHCGM